MNPQSQGSQKLNRSSKKRLTNRAVTQNLRDPRERKKAQALGAAASRKGSSSPASAEADWIAGPPPSLWLPPWAFPSAPADASGCPGAGKRQRPSLGWLERASCTTSAEPERSSSAPQLGQDGADSNPGEDLGFPGVKGTSGWQQSRPCLASPSPEPRQMCVGKEIASYPGDPAAFPGPLLMPPMGAAPPLFLPGQCEQLETRRLPAFVGNGG